jgi:CyaY protein
MDAQQYYRAAQAYLERVSRWLDQFEDVDTTAGDGIVTMEFEDGARFVLNRQSAASQLWFAAGARAWHYNWDPLEESWGDDRDGHALDARIAEVVGDKLGRRLSM